jgi:excisionase family DNA binding protein
MVPTTSPRNGEGGPDSRLRAEGLTTSPNASVREGHDAQALEPLLRARDVAELLNLSANTVLDWFEAGRLPGFKINGGPVRFSSSEIAEWVSAQHREATQ